MTVYLNEGNNTENISNNVPVQASLSTTERKVDDVARNRITTSSANLERVDELQMHPVSRSPSGRPGVLQAIKTAFSSMFTREQKPSKARNISLSDLENLSSSRLFGTQRLSRTISNMKPENFERITEELRERVPRQVSRETVTSVNTVVTSSEESIYATIEELKGPNPHDNASATDDSSVYETLEESSQLRFTKELPSLPPRGPYFRNMDKENVDAHIYQDFTTHVSYEDSASPSLPGTCRINTCDEVREFSIKEDNESSIMLDKSASPT
ncbi:MAG: hypothetical protein WCG10_07700 [Chlamydiota bacterium]